MRMKKVGLGIIGLGHMGKIHLQHSLRLPNVNLIAVSDLSKKTLKEAKSAGIRKAVDSYEQILEEPNIDAVIIALPTHLHLQCAKRAAEERKHIFLEKPIAKDLEQAREIVASAKKNCVKLMMGYPLRFNEPFRELKTKIENGMLGDVEITYATFISSGPFFHRAESHRPVPVPEWWFNKELTGGGALIDFGSHIINLLRWYFGEITDIKSHLGYRFHLDIEDSAVCLTKFESGPTAVISVGWFLQGYELKVELFGTVGCASTQKRQRNRLLATTKRLATGISEFRQPNFDELRHFVRCVTNDLSPSPSGRDGLRDLEAICQAYKNQIRLD